MKRSSQKELYPNYFEFGAGGSVLAGEDSLSAVLRELKEADVWKKEQNKAKNH